MAHLFASHTRTLCNVYSAISKWLMVRKTNSVYSLNFKHFLISFLRTKLYSIFFKLFYILCFVCHVWDSLMSLFMFISLAKSLDFLLAKITSFWRWYLIVRQQTRIDQTKRKCNDASRKQKQNDIRILMDFDKRL